MAVPGGKVEHGESAEAAAVRETREETALTVRAVRSLGNRVHPSTGRIMVYVACEVVGSTAHVAAEREVAEVAWCDRAAAASRILTPFHGPVQKCLDAAFR